MIPPKKEEIHLKDHPYSKMRKLRFLMIHNVKISGPCEHLLSNNLRLLLWDECPLKFLPSSFHPKNLVELRIRCSNISQLWNEKVSMISLNHSTKPIFFPFFIVFIVYSYIFIDLNHHIGVFYFCFTQFSSLFTINSFV